MRIPKRMAMTSERTLLRLLRMPLAVGAALVAKERALLSRRWLEHNATWIVAGIVVLQVLLSLPRLLWGSIWYDEFLTITTIGLPWRQIASGGYPKELHPPLYFLMLKGWLAVFGRTELAMRLFSLGLSAGSLVMLFLLTRRLIDLRAALATILLFAIHPMYIFYATEVRMYALLIFCSLAAVFTAWHYCTASQVSLLALCGLAIAVAAAMYTHYFGTLAALAIGILSIVRLVLVRDRRAIAVLAVLIACALIALLGVSFILQRQIHEYRATYSIPADQRLTWQVFPGLLSGSASVFFSRMLLVNCVSLVAATVGCLVLWRNGHRIVVLTILWLLILSALVAFVVSANGIDVASRYLLHISVLSLLLLGATCMWQKPAQWWIRPGIIGMLILSIYLYLGATFSLQSAQLHPNWRAVATFLRETEQPGEPIVVLGWDAIPLQFYLPDRRLMTSYDLETELQKQSLYASYLLVQSENGRLPPLSKPTTELWQNPDDHISIMRYRP